jgi:hypothetical protein
LILVALVALVAGCGGGSKKSSSPATTTEATSTTTAETETPSATETTSSESNAASFATSKNCLKLLGVSSTLAQAFAQSGAENDLDKQAKFFEDFANQTPEEIRGDFQLIAKAFTTFASEYSKLNLKPGSVPTAEQIAKFEKFAKEFNSAKMQAASAHIEAWAKKNCSSG